MKYVLLFLLLFLIASPTWAAVTYDTSTTHSDTDAGSTSSFSHTFSGCANGIILVGTAVNAVTPPTVSALTYNGAALTQIDSRLGSSGSRRIELWYKVAPSSGSNTISLTLSDVADQTSIFASTYCGVNQGTAIGTPAAADGASTTPSVAVSSASGELVIDAVMLNGDTGQSLTVNGSQTQRVNFCYNADCNGGAILGSSEEAGAGSVSMDWTAAVSQYWAIIGVALKPAATVKPAIAVIMFQ